MVHLRQHCFRWQVICHSKDNYVRVIFTFRNLNRFCSTENILHMTHCTVTRIQFINQLQPLPVGGGTTFEYGCCVDGRSICHVDHHGKFRLTNRKLNVFRVGVFVAQFHIDEHELTLALSKKLLCIIWPTFCSVTCIPIRFVGDGLSRMRAYTRSYLPVWIWHCTIMCATAGRNAVVNCRQSACNHPRLMTLLSILPTSKKDDTLQCILPTNYMVYALLAKRFVLQCWAKSLQVVAQHNGTETKPHPVVSTWYCRAASRTSCVDVVLYLLLDHIDGFDHVIALRQVCTGNYELFWKAIPPCNWIISVVYLI